MTKPDCYKCEYRGDVPDAAHSCCKYPGNDTQWFRNAYELKIRFNPHGVGKNWLKWPVEFDPAWLENCVGFKEKESL